MSAVTIDLEFLQQFCASPVESAKYSRPFTVGEYTYAGTGRFLVRVPALGGVVVDAVPPTACGLMDAPLAGWGLRAMPDDTARRQVVPHGVLVCVSVAGGLDRWLPLSVLAAIQRLPGVRVYTRAGTLAVRFVFNGGTGVFDMSSVWAL